MQAIPDNSISCDNGGASTGFAGQDIVQDLTKTCSMLTNQVLNILQVHYKQYLKRSNSIRF